MTDRRLFLVLITVVVFGCESATWAGSQAATWPDTMTDSIVYVTTSTYPYNAREPWKHEDLRETWSCASAVGAHQVITTAASIADHTDIKVLRYGQNEFIPATAKVIDYASDLCLLELDRDALREPLTPLLFSDNRPSTDDLSFHWLSPDSRLYSGRGHFDRASVEVAITFFGRRLRFVAANTSQEMGVGELYCAGQTPVGIGCWAGDNKQTDVIPGQIINRFLEAAKTGSDYCGFGELGFSTSELRDPAVRSFLRMPQSLRNGVYVDDVYTLGTGSDCLKKRDVILKVDGHEVDALGRYTDPVYGALSFHHLITRKLAGDNIPMVLWRDGQRAEISVQIKRIKADEMLVPFHEFDQQPQYAIVGGFLFQKLTRTYLSEFGDNLEGRAPSHLYYYYRNMGLKPSDQRRDIVILSYVLPVQTNLGYTSLGRMVVKEFNGMPVTSIRDIITAQALNPDSPCHVVELDLDGPTIVIPRQALPAVDTFITQNYGIAQLSNIRP